MAHVCPLRMDLTFWEVTQSCFKSSLKDHSSYKVAKNLAKLCLCSNVLWKVELLSNETEDVALLLPADDNEVQEKRNDFKRWNF